MTDRTYTVAGVSTQNGETKVRFANDLVSRMKTLTANGHTDIHLIEFGEPVSKNSACMVLINHPDFQTESAQSAIAGWISRNGSAVYGDPVIEVELVD